MYTHVCWCTSLCEYRGQEGPGVIYYFHFFQIESLLEPAAHIPTPGSSPKDPPASTQPLALRSQAPPSLL